MNAAVTIGLDLGTSGVKAVLLDGRGQVLAEATAALTVQRPQPLWSEQSPADWLAAADAAVLALKAGSPAAAWATVAVFV